MSPRIDIATAIVGTGLASGPAMVDIPFYETKTWLATVAILGMVVLVFTAIRVVRNFIKTLKWDGKDRRNDAK